jgi:antitoxin CcdA
MSDKVRAEITLEAGLLERARARRIDLSAVLEERLRHVLAEDRTSTWQAENAEAIAAANAFLSRHGLWSDGRRQF